MDKDTIAVQQYYPRIYHACHCEHIRAKSSPTQLSARDSTLLAHLSAEEYTSPSRLAEHLNISRATLSEALATLSGLGYVLVSTDENDARRQNLKLSEKGMAALSAASVLDYKKLHQLMQRLSETERKAVVHGLALLANATSKTSSECA